MKQTIRQFIMSKLMPVLKPFDYQKKENLLYKMPLIEESNSPIIVFAIDEGNFLKFEYAANEKEYEQNFQKIYKQALQNLKEIKPQIQINKLENEKIVFVIGNEYVSEKIIDKNFMQEISKELESDNILVGVPFRGILVAIDSKSNLSNKFLATIKKYYQNAPLGLAITDNIFLLQNGEITAMAGEEVQAIGLNYRIIEDTQSNNYEIEIFCNSLNQLTDLINNSFQKAMYLIMDKKSFGGNLSFNIKGDFNLSELTNKCNNYIKSIKEKEIVKILFKHITKSPVIISFSNNNNKIISEELKSF